MPLPNPFAAPPAWTPYERELHRRTLARVLWIMLAVITGLLMINYFLVERLIPRGAMLGLAVACLGALWLNAQGAYYRASALLSVATIAVTTTILIESYGLRDSGTLALPVLIILGALLFGKRAVPFALFAVLAVLAATALAHRRYLTHGFSNEIGRLWTPSALLTMCVLLIGTAVVIWVIMDNAERHLAQIKRSEEELLRAYDLTLEGWAKVVEYRDRITEGHSRRVAAMSVRLARAMGLSEEDVVHVRRGALLHDIGKLAVPDAILWKHGPLNPQERAVMNQHPATARALLAEISFLEPTLSIPYSHHERWDGRGYPDGLAGNEIPLAARIFSVVDQWDALSSDRPYRAALPLEQIVVYLKTNAGTIFDPQVVRTFLEVVWPAAERPLHHSS
jgi:putative nucleotidyltransferase with HDIG domain